MGNARKTESHNAPEPTRSQRAPRRAAKSPQGLHGANAAATRAKILDAAVIAFAEKGFDGARSRDIASAAKVNMAMITYHFGGKEELWRAAVTHLFTRMRIELGSRREVMGKLRNGGIRAVIGDYIRYCARHPEHARLMMQESIRGGDRLDWMVKEFIAPGHSDAFRKKAPELYDLLVEKGDPLLVTYMIVAACQVPYVLAAEIKKAGAVDPFDDEFIEGHVDAVVRLIGAA